MNSFPSFYHTGVFYKYPVFIIQKCVTIFKITTKKYYYKEK